MATPSVIGTTSHGYTTGSQSSLTLASHVVPSGTIALVVIVGYFTLIRDILTPVAWGANNLILAARPRDLGSANKHGGEVWVLLNPTPGTANVVITPNGSDFLCAGAYNISDGGAVFNCLEKSGTVGAAGITSSSDTGTLMIDFMMSDNDSDVFTEGAGQTLIYADNGVPGTNIERSASSYKAGSSPSTAMSFTRSGPGGTDFGYLVIGIAGSGGSGGSGESFSAAFG